MDIFQIPPEQIYPARQKHNLLLRISQQGVTASMECLHEPIQIEGAVCHGYFFLDNGLDEFFEYFNPESDEGHDYELQSGVIYSWIEHDETFCWRYQNSDDLAEEASEGNVS